MPDDDLVSVRYMVEDVQSAIDFYTRHFDFTLRHRALPAFADVVRGKLRPTARARRLEPHPPDRR
jgi:catechol 2,3-dioxygenase-like lactoylglutathione lyase family enzyme